MSRTTTKGTVKQVPCPWCKGPLNFEEEQAAEVVEAKNKFFCDHCSGEVEIVRAETVKILVLRQSGEGK